MGKKLYEPTEEGGIQFKSERQSGEVRVPNYVYDIWMPLIGAEAVGLYSVYCRLEREGVVKGMTLVELANACRIGKASLMTLNERLQECGFLKLAQPDGKKRLMHFTTEITVLDPPQQIPAEIIAKYQPNRGYEPLTPWLVNGEGEEPEEEPPEVDELDEGQPELPEVPTRTSGGSNQNHAEGIGRTAKIADPLVLQPSDVGPEDGALPRAPAPDPPAPAKRSRSEAQIAQAEMTCAIADLCFCAGGSDKFELLPVEDKSNVRKSAKQLRDAGYSADDVEAFGAWWRQNDWRGERGDRPTVRLLKSEWAKFLEWRVTPGKRKTKNGRKPAKTGITDDALRSLAARQAWVDAHPDATQDEFNMAAANDFKD